MKKTSGTSSAPLMDLSDRLNPHGSPFLRAPETARTIFLTMSVVALAPLAAGLVYFGWRSLYVTALSVLTCMLVETVYYRVSRAPALLGRSHSFLTGLLLALTLPAHVPWYVPIVGGAFATLVGKAIFGGVGHFLWQPALVGRLAVAVLFAQQIANPYPPVDGRQVHPGVWPILSQEKIIVGDILNAGGDVLNAGSETRYHWRRTSPQPGRDALWLMPVNERLSPLTDIPESWRTWLDTGEGYSKPLKLFLTRVLKKPEEGAKYSSIGYAPSDVDGAMPGAMRALPPINDLLLGARPGGIGETCAIVIVIAGLYMIYRHYVKWQLPAAFLFAACVVAALAPVQLQGPNNTVVGNWGPAGGWALSNWFSGQPWTLPPLLREGLDVGVIYVCFQMLSGEFLLAAFFLAPEMTSPPVTSGGQVLFGLGAGAAAMLLRLYVDTPVPAYIAVLLMNTFTPLIDRIWRPRVLGMRRFGGRAMKIKGVSS
jgi:Na+-translocating ferredoxin:NAD+ oxidoreductase RnfD subunit